MSELTNTRLTLPSGITLNVASGGPRGGEAIVLLHGFPESHRTWRAVAPVLAEDRFVVAPDQRGFGASDKPSGTESYRTDRLVGDLIGLADALGLERFTLVGHDWGGVVAWLAALQHPERIDRLVIVNAPHPLVFQKSLFDHAEQRAASQYITAFRSPDMEQAVVAMGLEAFFDTLFGRHVDPSTIPADERARYLADWSAPGALTAMLNWYRASDVVVPAPSDSAEAPGWTRLPFPAIKVPTLVFWAMRDTALLPVQLDGLGDLVEDLEIVQFADAGHFVPWENPEPVVRAIQGFLRSVRGGRARPDDR
jgi:pimeloyl-ACP methyl ester carboxylesterase